MATTSSYLGGYRRSLRVEALEAKWLLAGITISEFMYNPPAPTAGEIAAGGDADNDAYEFIELTNTGTVPIDMTGYRFVTGVDLIFPAVTVQPGQYVVLASDPQSFQVRYGPLTSLLGTAYTGSLSNGGEQLELVDGDPVDPNTNTVFDFRYDDGWHSATDGGGWSLELLVPQNTSPDDLDNPSEWRASVEYGGTPGAANAGPLKTVVINEVLASAPSFIELFNTAAVAIDLSGWCLTDDPIYGCVLPMSGVIEGDDYRTTDALGLDLMNGGLWLLDSNDSLIHSFENLVQTNGESWGLYPNGTGIPAPMLSVTYDAPNSGPRVGPVVFTEVMYHHPTDDLFEFIEISNPTPIAVDLTDWRIRGGIDYNFDPGTTLPASDGVSDGILVIVPFNPGNPENSDLLYHFWHGYGIDINIKPMPPTAGGYVGELSDSGEKIQLLRPFASTFILEDEVDYDDGPPWPTDPDGGGQALHRNDTTSFGNDPYSWHGAAPSPGLSNHFPVANHDFYTTDEHTLISVAAPGVLDNDTDADGDPLTVTKLTDLHIGGPTPLVVGSVNTLASGASLTVNSDGSFIYDPAGQLEWLSAGHTFGELFLYEISDGNGGFDKNTLAIHVYGVNDAPVANVDVHDTDEDTSLVVTAPGILLNDTDVDRDDYTLTVTKVVGDPARVGKWTTLGSGALLRIDDDGKLSYDPNGQFEALGEGEHDTEIFSYEVGDGNGGFDTAIVNITVWGVDDVLLPDDLADAVADLPLGSEITVSGDPENIGDWIDSISLLPAQPVTDPETENIVIVLELDAGTYDIVGDVSVPVGYTLVAYDRFGGSTTFIGQSPALSLVAGMVIVQNGVTFVNTTETATIRVSGGMLTLRNSTIEETAVGDQAAIEILGGIVDVGTVGEPGGNILVINGVGRYVDNLTATPMLVHGNTYMADDTEVFSTSDPVVVGTPNGDEIHFTVGANPDEIEVSITGLRPETITGATRLVAYGGNGDDMMLVEGGIILPTWIYAQGGNDIVFGGSGNDTVHAGSGNDIVFGRGEVDAIFGDEGNDILFGGCGDDFIDGGLGYDLLVGGLGDDDLDNGKTIGWFFAKLIEELLDDLNDDD